MLEKKLEQFVEDKKVGLWRSHPSFFFVALFFVIEGAINSWIFLRVGANTASYQRLFEYVPEPVFGLFFLASALIILTALLSKRHYLLRIGGGIMLIPNMMMVVNFLLLLTEGAVPAIWVASAKWTLTCLMLALMMYEPFINPNSAR